MKNLKKVLCLALAFAMVLGLCVTGFAADSQDVTKLADWSEVGDKSAALLLNAFNIMQGDDEGFRPDDLVKRTEAAKMLSVALWGGDDDVKLYSANNIGGYTDVVSGSWYMGYVNFMTVQKIMVGSDGKFNVNGEVTGYELLKMCLVALGYNPDTEGLTGAGWDMRTMALATKPNFMDLTWRTTVEKWDAPLTRMNAARIIANMIARQTVTYDLVTGTNNATEINTRGTFGAVVLGMDIETGILVANEFGSIAAFSDDDVIDTDDRYYNNEDALVMFGRTRQVTVGENVQTQAYNAFEAFDLDTTFDQLGHAVQAYYKNGALVYVGLAEANEVEPVFRSNAIRNVDVADNYANGARYFVNGAQVASFGAMNIGAFNTAGNAFYLNSNAEVTYLDTDGDGYIDVVKATIFDETLAVGSVAETEKYGVVYMNHPTVAWNQSRYEASVNNQVKASAVLADTTDLGDELAVGDHAVKHTTVNCFGDNMSHGYVLEAVEGKVTQKTTDSYGNITLYIDGVKYSDISGAGAGLGNEGTFYLWADGNIAQFVAAAGTSLASNTYALVYDAGHTQIKTGAVGSQQLTLVQVAAVLPDGTSKVFDVANIVVVEGTGDNTTFTTLPMDNQTETTVENGLLKADNTVFKKSDDSVVKLFGTSGGEVFNGVPTTTSGEGTNNPIMPYTLNADGSINLYVQTLKEEELKGGETIDVTAKASALNSSSETRYFSNNSVVYVQTGTVADGVEKWVAYKGITAPAFKTEYTAPATSASPSPTPVGTTPDYVVGDYSQKGDGLLIAALRLGATEYTQTTAASTGIFYIVTQPSQKLDENNKTIWVADVYNSETDSVSEMTWTGGTQLAAGTVWTSFNAVGGFATEIKADIAANNYGFYTSFSGNVLRIATYDIDGNEQNSSFYTVDPKVTRYFVINGADTCEIKAADLLSNLNSSDEVNKYEVVVALAKDASGNDLAGQAGTVLVYATTQTFASSGAASATVNVAPITVSKDALAAITGGTDFTDLAISATTNTIVPTAQNTYDVTFYGTATKLGEKNTGFGAAYSDHIVVAIQLPQSVKGDSVTVGGKTWGPFGTTDAEDCVFLFAITQAQATASGTTAIVISYTDSNGHTTGTGSDAVQVAATNDTITINCDFSNITWSN